MAFFRTNKNRKLIIVLALLIVLLAAGFIYVRKVFAATKCWDGGGTTNNWSENANWAGPEQPMWQLFTAHPARQELPIKM